MLERMSELAPRFADLMTEAFDLYVRIIDFEQPAIAELAAVGGGHGDIAPIVQALTAQGLSTTPSMPSAGSMT